MNKCREENTVFVFPYSPSSSRWEFQDRRVLLPEEGELATKVAAATPTATFTVQHQLYHPASTTGFLHDSFSSLSFSLFFPSNIACTTISKRCFIFFNFFYSSTWERGRGRVRKNLLANEWREWSEGCIHWKEIHVRLYPVVLPGA